MPSDLDKLQGSWSVTLFEIDARREPAPPGAKITIRSNRFASVGMGAAYEGILELGQEKRRKTIDLIFDVGHAAGVRNIGIYQLTANSWTLCLATRGTDRPTEFVSLPGTGIALERLEREQVAGASPNKGRATAKASTVAVGAAPSSAIREGVGAATEIEGEWAMVSAIFDGAPLDAKMISWCKRITRGDVTTVMAGPQTMLAARFTIDASQRPRAIDYVNLSGSAKGKAQAGVYEVNGDALQICMSPPGVGRPMDFASVRGDGRSHTTWRRSKL
jgi:uncharacterized protein (TIGR03067 family)